MTLDPIVSLSVAIAEAPGSHAFFLGSGISREAGVPTGQQVFWQAAGELYRLEEEDGETPDEEGLREWLKKRNRDQLGYSDLLELIAPDPANRRDYLAKHFEGREPGKAHQRLAALAEQGAVKVFVTTNFDRLLEHALQARGIEPVRSPALPGQPIQPCVMPSAPGHVLQSQWSQTRTDTEARGLLSSRRRRALRCGPKTSIGVPWLPPPWPEREAGSGVARPRWTRLHPQDLHSFDGFRRGWR